MKNKVWVKSIIETDNEQSIHIQPTPEMDGAIQVYFGESDNKQLTNPIYLYDYEVEVFCRKMKEMLQHIKSQNEYDTKREG